MKKFSRSALPWVLAVLFAAAFLTLALSRRSTEAARGRAPLTPTSPPAGASRKILYWTDPMVPGYKSDKPGKSPFMDMDLVPVYEDGSTAAPSPGVEGYATITVPLQRQQSIGVQLGKAEMRDLTKAIRTVGVVTFDERLLHHIHTKFEGYVEKLYVDYTGKAVRKGQPLLSIYSPELLATQQEYLLAYRAREQFRSSANPDVSRSAAELYDAARQRLLLWDISADQIRDLEKSGTPQKVLTLYSPVDGFVMTRNAVEGARVMPSDTLFEIAGIRHVWVLADVYESEAPFVKLGQKARVSLSYLPGRTWTGTVSFISPVLDEKSRTVKVRLEFDNPDETLKPEMYADVTLERPLGRVLTVPEGAVLSTGTRSIVFVAKGEGRFEPRTVQVGARVDGVFEIREGVAAGEEVVTQANFLIDSESRLKAALGTMAPSASGPATPGAGTPAPVPAKTPPGAAPHAH